MTRGKHLLKAFWNDESGAILTTEVALLGTLGVVGATVGISAAGESINEEWKELAFSIRSLDQSYEIPPVGCRCSKAWTAGSSYQQKPVEEAHAELRERIRELEEGDAEYRDAAEKPLTPGSQPAQKTTPQADDVRPMKKKQEDVEKRKKKRRKKKRRHPDDVSI